MTAKRSNGAHAPPQNIFPFAAMMHSPAASSFLVSQRVALEAARFWARRMRAYADQMETLAGCSSVDDVAAAQSRFLDQAREDYAAETKAMTALLKPESTALRNDQSSEEKSA